MMAQLRPSPADPMGRISQLLPTVKCSNCGSRVTLSELGDHICSSPPPVPSLPRPSVSPTQATSLLPQRLQNLVSGLPSPSNRDARSLSPARPRINTSVNPASAPSSSMNPSPMRAPFMTRERSGSIENTTPSTARPPLDTRAGGEGGMAGVGRRGFQRVVLEQPAIVRSNPPKFLDLEPPRQPTGTPALSTGSSYSSYSSAPKTPSRSRPPSPDRYRSYDTPSTAQPRRKGIPIPERGRRPPSRPASPSSGSDYGGLAYQDTDEEFEADRVLRSKANPPPPLSLSGSLLGRSKSRERRANNGTVPAGPRIAHKKSSGSVSSVSSAEVDKDRSLASAKIAHAFGLSQTPPNVKMGGPGLPRSGRSASGSSSGGRSGYTRNKDSGNSGPAQTETGKLEKAMETLLEDVGGASTYGGDDHLFTNGRPGLAKSKSTGKKHTFAGHSRGESFDSQGLGNATMNGVRTQRSNTVQGSTSSPETKTVKLPTRARSEREKSVDSTSDRKVLKRVKVCVRCEKRIEDGRWIQVDGGGILCERCWKNMYLPKCRRCNLPIEKQAVSSSDGQLKGKYHKECFNCHVCHEPFPDKTFYVYDGKPHCAYHYHEQNNSLCHGKNCGLPIEGPCAVSHNGDRYHPEHLLCEFAGFPRCKEKLEDYFEVDGKMLCERHARMSRLTAIDDDKWTESTRAMKRKTRFMNLGSGLR